MKKLSAFLRFDTVGFLDGKRLLVNSVGEWIDFDTKAHMGTKLEVVIIEDRTKYPCKDGEQVSNRFEKFNVKVRKDGLAVKPNDYVKLVNAEGKVYGDYRNQLSVTCDDVVVANPVK